MRNQEQTIERIVALVVQRLTASDAAQSPPDAATAAGQSSGDETVIADAVITEHTLLAVAKPGTSIKVGPRSILTPSAHDHLQSRKITWSRTQNLASTQSAARRLLIISNDFGGCDVDSGQMAHGLPLPCDTRTASTDAQAAQTALQQITSSRKDLIVVACDCAARVACLSNRDARLRAAVVDSRAEATRLSQTLGANVLCLDAAGKSTFELRHLVRSILTLPVPAQPADWDLEAVRSAEK